MKHHVSHPVKQAEELGAARQLLDSEVAKVSKQVGYQAVVDSQYVEAWQNALSEMIYLPSQKRYSRIASATNSDKVESLQVILLPLLASTRHYSHSKLMSKAAYFSLCFIIQETQHCPHVMCTQKGTGGNAAQQEI